MESKSENGDSFNRTADDIEIDQKDSPQVGSGFTWGNSSSSASSSFAAANPFSSCSSGASAAAGGVEILESTAVAGQHTPATPPVPDKWNLDAPDFFEDEDVNGKFVKLMGKDYLEICNELRDCGLPEGKGLETPQLVVVGDQSAGKSSVLERIIGITFPRGEGTCTSGVTELRLKKTKGPFKVKIEKIPTTSFSFSSEVETAAEISKHIAKISQDLVDGENDSDSDSDSKSKSKSKFFFNHKIQITISGEELSDLTLIDLPGIVNNDVSGRGDKDKIQKLVKKYMESPQSIVLLVLDAQEDQEKHTSWSLFQEVAEKKDIEPAVNERTLGVLTKLDKDPNISEERQRSILDLAKNKSELKLKWSYIAVRNRTQKEVDLTVTEVDEQEQQFFKEHPQFKKMNWGIEELKEKLVDLQAEHCKEQAPKIIAEIVKNTTDLKEEIKEIEAKLPPTDGNLQLKKSKTLDRFKKEFKQENEVSPDKNGNRRVTFCVTTEKELEILKDKINRVPMLDEKVVDEERDNHPGKDWTEKENHYKVLRRVLEESIKQWEKPTQDALDKLKTALEDQHKKACNKVCPEEVPFRAQMIKLGLEVIQTSVKKLKKKLEEKRNLMVKYPYKPNPSSSSSSSSSSSKPSSQIYQNYHQCCKEARVDYNMTVYQYTMTLTSLRGSIME